MAERMRAMEFRAVGEPLSSVERPLPSPGPGELLLKVSACAVCRTDLHIVDGDLVGPRPIVPGHEVIGRVVAIGGDVSGFAVGNRVGVPWLGATCGTCPYCTSGAENLCDAPTFTGFTRDGGFATHMVAYARYCFAIPDGYDDHQAAPLLCAGLIGFRSYRMAGDAPRLGLYGFGAAAHILAQIAVGDGRRAFAFTRPGDSAGQDFARRLGCAWAGASGDTPPEELDAAIIFAPVGALVPEALRRVRKGGRVVCAGIHMSDIPSFPYEELWGERQIVSVANLTRADGVAFMEAVTRRPVTVSTTPFPLAQANEALAAVRGGTIEGAAVLVP